MIYSVLLLNDCNAVADVIITPLNTAEVFFQKQLFPKSHRYIFTPSVEEYLYDPFTCLATFPSYSGSIKKVELELELELHPIVTSYKNMYIQITDFHLFEIDFPAIASL